jgi:hypothetical protein
LRDRKDGQTQGDIVTDFNGNGAAVGDQLLLVGWGAGAFLTNLGAGNWLVQRPSVTRLSISPTARLSTPPISSSPDGRKGQASALPDPTSHLLRAH